MLSFLELKTLTQLSDRHLFHQTMTSSLSWIESLGSLNRDFLKLSNLSDELSLLCQLSSLLILALLETLLKLFVNLISDIFVLLLFEGDLLSCCLFVGMDLSDNIFLLCYDFLKLYLALIHHDIHLCPHLVNQRVIFFLLPFSCSDGFFTG